nr:MAG TPA: hypothetical protein [Caudoviricetes sp.]
MNFHLRNFSENKNMVVTMFHSYCNQFATLVND